MTNTSSKRIIELEYRKTVIKLIMITEVTILIMMFGLTIFKWRNEYLVPSRIDMWSSRGIEFNEGWCADERLINNGIVTKGVETEVIFGPYISLEKGDYIVSIDYEASQNQSFTVCAFEQNDRIICKDTVLPYNSLSKIPQGNSKSASFEFVVSEPIENAEVRIGYNGYGYINIKNISIVRSAYKYRNAFKFLFMAFLLLDIILGLIIAAKSRERVRTVISYAAPFVLLTATIVSCVVYVLMNGELYISEAMSKYAGLILLVFRKIFYTNWILARAVMTGFGLVLYAILFIVICIKLNIDIRYAAWTAAIIVMPFSIANIRMITFGTHQLFEGVAALLVLYLIIRTEIYKKNIYVVSVLYTVVIVCLSIIRPLFVLDNNACINSGYQITTGITGGILFEILSTVLSVFGWHQNNIMAYEGTYDGRLLHIGQHYYNYIAFFLVVVFAMAVYFVAKEWKSIEPSERLITIMVICMIAFDSTLTLLFLREKSFDYYYWIRIVPLVLIMVMIWFKYQNRKNALNIIVLVCTFGIMSIVSVKDFESEPLRSYPELAHLTDFLEYNGYTTGYSSDDYSYVIEELSNGTINMVNDGCELSVGQFVVKKSEEDIANLDVNVNGKIQVIYENTTDFGAYEVIN